MYKFIDIETDEVVFESSSFRDLLLGLVIEYRTFRSNGDFGAPFLNYVLKVVGITKSVEMGWNRSLDDHGTNVHVKVVSKEEVELDG